MDLGPKLPRCKLILVADEKPFALSLRGKFPPRLNLACWDGLREGDKLGCGGGQRIIKKGVGGG